MESNPPSKKNDNVTLSFRGGEASEINEVTEAIAMRLALECLEPDSTYQIQNEAVKNGIRKLLKPSVLTNLKNSS